MKTACKSVLPSFVLLFSFLFLQITTVSADTDLTSCPGEPVTLNWTSGNVAGCSTNVVGGGGACSFSPAPGVPGSQAISLNSGSCSVYMTCSPVPELAATLTVVETQACCGQWANSAEPVWDAGQCNPIPVVTFDSSFLLTCTYADSYAVTLDGSPYQSGAYTGPITIPHSTPGTYVATCGKTAGANTYTSIPVTRAYTGTLGTLPSSCVIPINGTFCENVYATWTTSNTADPKLVDRNTGDILSTLANKSAPGLAVLVAWDHTTFDLKDGSVLFDTKTVTSSCATNSYWDPDANKCAPDPIASVSGLVLTCGNTSGGTYQVSFGGNVIQSGSYTSPVTVAPVGEGTYTVSCTRNGVTSPVYTFDYLGDLSLSSTLCTVPIGGSTCTVDATWTTTGAASPALVDRNTSSLLSTAAQNLTGQTVYVHHDGTNFDLKDATNLFVFDTKYASGVCQNPSIWWANFEGNPVNRCLNTPEVQTFTVENQYTEDGNLFFVCQDATDYAIQRRIPPAVEYTYYKATTTYPGAGVTIDVSGQTVDDAYYRILCINDEIYTPSSPLEYKKTPPPPAVSVTASPRTIQKGSQSTISWVIDYPVSACKISATPVCTSHGCNPSQLTSSSTINTILATGNTDSSDPNNAVRGNSSISVGATAAIRKILLPININFPWQAKGQRTFIIDNSMDFQVWCAAGTNGSAKVRVTVTSNNEG